MLLAVVAGSVTFLPVSAHANSEAPADDTLCFGLRATIVGTDHADFLHGTRGDDVIVGLDGNDIIEGLGGNDYICGGRGADQISVADEFAHDISHLGGGPGKDDLAGGSGNDLMFGGPDNDTLGGGGNQAGSDMDRLNGGAGNGDYCYWDDRGDQAINCEVNPYGGPPDSN
jgi:Ca2+-binding RTX toxin-like protein